MLTLIDGAAAWAQTIATQPDPEQFRRVLKVFEDARAHLLRRIHDHGMRAQEHNH